MILQALAVDAGEQEKICIGAGFISV